jgi:hypothetical protein
LTNEKYLHLSSKKKILMILKVQSEPKLNDAEDARTTAAE